MRRMCLEVVLGMSVIFATLYAFGVPLWVGTLLGGPWGWVCGVRQSRRWARGSR